MKADQERVSKLLTDTVTLLCKNGLVYSQEIKIQGLLGITLDKNEVFIVHINEIIGGMATTSSRDTSTSSTTSSSEMMRRKNAPSGVAVVDLTRIADTPLPSPVHQISTSQQPSGLSGTPGTGGRKQRSGPLAPGPPPPPLVAAQQMAQRMPYNARPSRVNTNSMQQAINSQMAATYLAQLQQQVSRGMMRMPPPLRQRMPSRRSQSFQTPVMPSVTADDDEDVVIIGTGHEEPSPNWNSPARRHPLPSHLTQPRPSPQPPTRCQRPSPANRHRTQIINNEPPSVVASNKDIEIAGTLEMMAEDIPVSSNSTIPLASSTCISAAETVVQNKVSVASESTSTPSSNQTKVGVAEGPATTSNQDMFSSDVVLSESGTKVVQDKDKTDANETEPSGQSEVINNPNSSEPFVYTDIAEVASSMEELSRAGSLMEIDIPGFDVLTADEQHIDSAKMMSWNCRAAHCTASYVDATYLANHYMIVHGSSLDLSPLPTVIVPSDVVSDSASDDDAQHSETSSDVNPEWQQMACPFVTCSLKFTSYPGLLMHHKRAHGVPLPASERRAIAAAHRVKLCGTRNAASDKATDCAEFVCLMLGCNMSYHSRNELIEHVRSVHPTMVSDTSAADDAHVSTCKQEHLDDKTVSK